MTILELNKQVVSEQKEGLLKCCGSNEWAEKLIPKFPFNSLKELKKKSDKIWLSLSEDDWKEAFSHHPKIGDVEGLKRKFTATAHWTSGEQAGVNEASMEILQTLKNLNDEYEKKFGYIFIVCATGKSAEEMLSILKERLQHSPGAEIKIAMQEQNKITHLRLEKLFA